MATPEELEIVDHLVDRIEDAIVGRPGRLCAIALAEALACVIDAHTKSLTEAVDASDKLVRSMRSRLLELSEMDATKKLN